MCRRSGKADVASSWEGPGGVVPATDPGHVRQASTWRSARTVKTSEGGADVVGVAEPVLHTDLGLLTLRLCSFF